MTKTEYLGQLDNKLRVLPYSERQDALDYYDGYISDANGEENAMAQLGSPGEVAAMILANYVGADEKKTSYTPTRRSGFKTAWVIILALFAIPVGLPLLIAVGATAFALFVSLAAVVFALGVGGIASAVAGMACMMAAPFVFIQDMGFGLIIGGLGLTSTGIGILLVRLAFYLMGGFAWIARFVGKKIVKRSKHHGRTTTEQPTAVRGQ
jgi:uncharacterized membrane protein